MWELFIGLTATAVLAGCGAAAGTASTTPSPRPSVNLSVPCGHIADLYANVLKPSQDGTLTVTDGVTKLGAAEDTFDSDATFYVAAGEPTLAGQYQALATAIGHYKVALSNGTDTGAAGQEMTDAINALPKCP